MCWNSFYSVHHVWLSKKKLQVTRKQKHSLKRLSCHQNQTQIWQEYWNEQIGNFEKYINMLTTDRKSRQHAITDMYYKENNENSNKKIWAIRWITPLKSSLVDWTQVMKESLSLRMSVGTSKTQKQKGKKMERGDRQNIQQLWNKYKGYNMSILGKTRKEKKEK